MASVDDESADRVPVPAAPDRDVEPFWAPEELDAPVHGRPVPHETAPAVPLPPNGAPGSYRPGEPVPVPPPHAVPIPPPAHVQMPPPPAPVQPPPGQGQVPQPRAAQPVHNGTPPNQRWPNLDQPPEAPVSGPTSGGPAPESGVHTSPDSPWSQPPQQRPPSAPAPVTPHHSASASVPVRRLETPADQPDVEEPSSGAVYRPGPPPPPGPGPQPGPPGPQPGPPPNYGQPYPTPPAPPRQMPGPYPPSIDPRAMPPQAAMPHPPAPAPGQPSTDPFQDLPWVSDGTPTAEEFARRRMAKPADPVATQGARAMLRKTTMGLVKLAPGKREQEYKQDVEMVRRNFGGLRQVTVVNPKGGAGKTVAVLLLAMTFGQKRGGYVLAWDNNETQGTLGMRAQQDFHARTVRDMMRDLHLFRGSSGRVGDLSQYVRAQGEGMFDVLASDESATAGEMLTASAFGEIREIVSRFYKLIFVDTGNNVRAQNWQAAMDATDQLVITMSARNDSAETAARMLDHLEQSGRQRLVRQAVSVVSMPPTRKDIDLPAIQRHFAARTRAVLLAPYEKLIDSGEPLRYGHLSANTKDAWLKIAAAVAEGL